MPRNSSGTYTLPGAVNPVAVDDFITALWANSTLDDIAAVLTASLDRSGNGGMLAQFKNFDGTVGAPGMGFTNEPSSGIYRAAAGEVALSILSTLVARYLQTRVEFQVIPQSLVDPSGATDLVRLSYLQTYYAPIAAPTFTGTPSSAAVPTSGSHLVNKTYADALVFASALPTQTGNAGKFVTTDGTTASWAAAPVEIPSQTGNSGKLLTTNGSSVSWAALTPYLPLTGGTVSGNLAVTGTVSGSNLAVTNWNTAYGWGSHAVPGYLTPATVGSYAPGLTGLGASGTWGISISGNAAYASTAGAAPANDVYAWAKAAVKPTYTYTEVGAQVAGSYPTGSGTCSGTNTGDQTNISGNAATATNVAWSGVTSKPINNVTFTTTTGSPTGGSSGDIYFVY